MNVFCTINVAFNPTTVGPQTGTLTFINSDVGSPQILALSGTGTGNAPASQTINFPNPGNQTYGVAPITLTATATSGLPVSYTVISGPATVSGSTLTITGAGSVTVQATQAGNTNYAAATPVSVTFTVADFTLSADAGSLDLQRGQNGTVHVTVAPLGGFNQPVSFACSGLPTGATCAFSPATVTPQGGAVSTLLTISTSATMSQRRGGILPWSGAGMVLAFCSLGIGLRNRRKLLPMLLLVAVTGLSLLLMACGGGFANMSSSTSSTTTVSPITSTVTVTATSGQLQHGTSFTLTVQ